MPKCLDLIVAGLRFCATAGVYYVASLKQTQPSLSLVRSQVAGCEVVAIWVDAGLRACSGSACPSVCDRLSCGQGRLDLDYLQVYCNPVQVLPTRLTRWLSSTPSPAMVRPVRPALAWTVSSLAPRPTAARCLTAPGMSPSRPSPLALWAWPRCPGLPERLSAEPCWRVASLLRDSLGRYGAVQC